MSTTVRTAIKLAPVYLLAALTAAVLGGCTSYGANRDAQQACQGFPEGTPEYANCYATVFSEAQASRRAAVSGALLNTQSNNAAIYSQPIAKPTYCYAMGNTINCF